MNSTLETKRPVAPQSEPAGNCQPVPAKIPVGVTGSRTNEKTGQRELFTEPTETVLLLPNGGVIRLSAATNPGQLVFLTNKETSREVVARVVKYRNISGGGGYAELDFTEPVPGFWGAHLPAELTRASFPTSAAGFKAAAEAKATLRAPADLPTEREKAAAGSTSATLPPASEKAAEGKGEANAAAEAGKQLLEQPAPNAASVEELRDELAFLQKQLDLLRTGSASSAAHPAEPQPPPNAQGVADALLKILDTARSSPQASRKEPVSAQAIARPSDSVANRFFMETKPSTAETAQDTDREQAFPEGSDALPPSGASLPEMRFAMRSAGQPPTVRRWLVLGTVGVGILAAAGWFWYSHRSRDDAVAASPAHTKIGATGAVNGRQTVQAKDAAPPPAPSLARKDAAATRTAPGPAASSAPPRLDLANGAREDVAPEPQRVKENASSRNTSIATSLRHSVGSTSPAGVARDDLQPAQVTKTVRAIAPPEATRGYVSGDVMIDAVVDASGRVTSMKVISGHELLRNAAMDALKKWQYQPATLNGKPVSSHVTAKIQFWYEP